MKGTPTFDMTEEEFWQLIESLDVEANISFEAAGIGRNLYVNGEYVDTVVSSTPSEPYTIGTIWQSAFDKLRSEGYIQVD